MSSIDKSFALQIKSLSESMELWNEKRSAYQPIIDKLEAAGVEPSFSGILVLPVTGNRDKLISIVRILRTSGLKSDSFPREGSSSFQAWYSNSDLSICAYLNFTSTVCRRVKVGTKTETVDVYEVQCGDEPELIEPAPTEAPAAAPEPVAGYPGDWDDDVPF